MTQKTAQYTVTNGLAGCYMPDNNSGPMEFYTRKDLASYIRDQLEFVFPELSGREYRRLFREVNLRNLWRMIQRHGSSSMHFSIQREGYELAFHGLTNAEFEQAEKESES